jgi:hypothetical protein
VNKRWLNTTGICILSKLLIRYVHALKSPRAICSGVDNSDDGKANSLRNVEHQFHFDITDVPVASVEATNHTQNMLRSCAMFAYTAVITSNHQQI